MTDRDMLQAVIEYVESSFIQCRCGKCAMCQAHRHLAQPPADYQRWTKENPPPESMKGERFWAYRGDGWQNFTYEWESDVPDGWLELAGPIPRPGEKSVEPPLIALGCDQVALGKRIDANEKAIGDLRERQKKEADVSSKCRANLREKVDNVVYWFSKMRAPFTQPPGETPANGLKGALDNLRATLTPEEMAQLCKELERSRSETPVEDEGDALQAENLELRKRLAQPPVDYQRWTKENPPPQSMVGQHFWGRGAVWPWTCIIWNGETGFELAGPIPRPGEKPVEANLACNLEVLECMADDAEERGKENKQAIENLTGNLADLRGRVNSNRKRIDANEKAIADLTKRVEHEHGVACNLSKRVAKMEKPEPVQSEVVPTLVVEGRNPPFTAAQPEGDAVEGAIGNTLARLSQRLESNEAILHDLVAAVRKADAEGKEVYWAVRPGTDTSLAHSVLWHTRDQAIKTMTANYGSCPVKLIVEEVPQ